MQPEILNRNIKEKYTSYLGEVRFNVMTQMTVLFCLLRVFLLTSRVGDSVHF